MSYFTVLKTNGKTEDLHKALSEKIKMRGAKPPFSWHLHQEKALQKKLYRAIHLARTNADYQLKYSSECRGNPERNVLHDCHPEAQKRIEHDHGIRVQMTTPPTVDRPKRLNRSV